MMILMLMDMTKPLHSLTIMLLLLLAMTLGVGVSTARAKAPTEADQTLTQSFVIQGYKMRVPDAYRNRHDRLFNGETTDKVRVHEGFRGGRASFDMLYPLMRAVIDSDRKRDAQNRLPTKIVKIFVQPNSKWHETVETRFFRRLYRDGLCNAKIFGDVCPHPISPRLDPDMKDHESFYLGSDYEFTICSVRDEFTVNPGYNMHFILLDHLKVSVYFNRQLLDDVMFIRESVIDLVCSWIDVPTDRKYFINRCK